MDLTVPAVNIFAVLLATVAAMVVGFVYYHPKVLGTSWMKAIGHTPDSVGKGPKPWVYPLIILCAFVTAWVLAGATWIAFEFYGGSFLLNALVTGWILFVGFTISRVVVHDAFDPRGFRVTGHTALNEFLIITVMALIIGVWPPAA
ncbi:DUF1761 domain-containing protein [Agrococcus beijingensis]|uniref:DUF1761 domain-containing protein n=1 Tax=Agrococcus beijingensis TaxID=3068634 RepID=UPI002741D75C|nr:DUF1761 domain-containing protein [Agrococcus sp. REN33]